MVASLNGQKHLLFPCHQMVGFFASPQTHCKGACRCTEKIQFSYSRKLKDFQTMI